jgi:S1-C subfamily serine protease
MTPGVSTVVPSTAPTTTAALIAAEVPEAYRNESCDYLEVAVVFAYERLDGRKKANDIEGQQIAQARIAARSKALSDKKCPPSSWVGGRIGISMDNIDPRYVAMYKIPAEGAIVLFVAPKGAADKAGVKVGDVITAVNDKPVRNAIDLRTVLGHSPIGSVQNLKIRRDTTFMVASPQMEGPATPLPSVATLISSNAAP